MESHVAFIIALEKEAMVMFLGENGLNILKCLQNGPATISDIHFLTGLPVECISTRIPALKQLGLIQDDGAMHALDELGWIVVDATAR
jgi:predicted transcriptional regulator